MHKGKKILALFMTILSAIALVAFFILPVCDNRSYLSSLLDMIDKLREVLHQMNWGLSSGHTKVKNN